ncbi:MAG: SpoIID/LytB domain-containing protein [Firmicutes bacterium]|nr:SpoIID/LytB domain-containing protein [Bacillota bacterium]
MRMIRGFSILIFVFLFFSPTRVVSASSRPLPERVKIGLATARPSLVLNLPAGTVISTPEGPRWQVELQTGLTLTGRNDGHLVAGETDFGPGPLRFAGPGFLGWNGRVYRGEFVVVRRPEGLTLINELAFEDYLRGVVPAEVDPTWPMEALKAQAVAARTFALARLGYHQREGFDLCASVHCQAYLGAGAERATTDAAVLDTVGQVITFQGRLISAYFHAASGGHTEDVEAVWPTATPFTYLRGVPDPAEVSPYDEWRVELDWSTVQAAVAAKYPGLGRLVSLVILHRTATGRVSTLELVGEKGQVQINGQEVRTLFGLRSTLFSLEVVHAPVPLVRGEDLAHLPVHPSPAATAVAWSTLLAAEDREFLPIQLVVVGRGWGHGVGLSQWGAKGLAEQGYTYIDILKYYYQGTEVEDWRPSQDIPPVPAEKGEAS